MFNVTKTTTARPLSEAEISEVVGSYDIYYATALASGYAASDPIGYYAGAQSWTSRFIDIIDYDGGLGGGWAVWEHDDAEGHSYGICLDPNSPDK